MASVQMQVAYDPPREMKVLFPLDNVVDFEGLIGPIIAKEWSVDSSSKLPQTAEIG